MNRLIEIRDKYFKTKNFYYYEMSLLVYIEYMVYYTIRLSQAYSIDIYFFVYLDL